MAIVDSGYGSWQTELQRAAGEAAFLDQRGLQDHASHVLWQAVDRCVRDFAETGGAVIDRDCVTLWACDPGGLAEERLPLYLLRSRTDWPILLEALIRLEQQLMSPLCVS